MRSRFELEQAMTKKGVEVESQADVLKNLEELGFLNDRQFAEAWVRNRDKLSPRGPALLKRELQEKGITEQIIGEVLAERKLAAKENEEQLTDEELARQLVNSKEGMYKRLPSLTRKRRIAGLLQRRGFSYEVIHRILNS